MSNLTDLGLVEVVPGDHPASWPAQIDDLLNALAAMRYRDSSTTAGASAALATIGTDVAGPAGSRVTATFDRQVRLRVTCLASVSAGALASARYIIQPGYNAGAFNFATVNKIGQLFNIAWEGSANRVRSGVAFAFPLLAAGTYTFYPVLQRAAGGNAGDVFDTFLTSVEVVSLV